MNIKELIKSLPVKSKKDEIPGTYQVTDELCPVCYSRMRIKKACCSNPNPTKECMNGNCGYKIIVNSDSM